MYNKQEKQINDIIERLLIRLNQTISEVGIQSLAKLEVCDAAEDESIKTIKDMIDEQIDFYLIYELNAINPRDFLSEYFENHECIEKLEVQVLAELQDDIMASIYKVYINKYNEFYNEYIRENDDFEEHFE